MKSHVVHIIRMADVEDPDLMVADPIWQWQQTEAGKWVMEHSVETPMWHREADPMTFGYKYAISAFFTEQDLVLWKLKYE